MDTNKPEIKRSFSTKKLVLKIKLNYSNLVNRENKIL